MKKLTLTVLLTLVTTMSAFCMNEDAEKQVKNNLRNKINMLLGKYKQELKTTANATIKFMINTNGEIVVLSVETEKENIERFVKQKLNYKKANVKNVKALAVYTVPVKFVKA